MRRADFFLTVCKWLACAAVVDWLIGRTFIRAAIHMPKSPPLLALYQALGVVGQYAFILTSVLALFALGVLVWQQRFRWRGALSFVLSVLAMSSVVFVVIPPMEWWSVGYHLLALTALVLIGVQAKRSNNLQVWLIPALAVACGELYILSAAVNNASDIAVASLNLLWFHLGELFVAASGIALWWFLARRRATRRMYLIALAPALFFGAAYVSNPSMTGVMAIWSMGLSLYLPWLVYAFSVWGASVAFLVFLKEDVRVSIALVLFAAGGFAPQLSAHAFFSLLGLWLLAISQITEHETVPRASDARAVPIPQT